MSISTNTVFFQGKIKWLKIPTYFSLCKIFQVEDLCFHFSQIKWKIKKERLYRAFNATAYSSH